MGKHRSAFLLSAVAGSAAALVPGPATAQDPYFLPQLPLTREVYVDTARMVPHARMAPPPFILAPDHLTARAEHQFRRGTIGDAADGTIGTTGVAGDVAAAQSPAKAAGGIDGSIRTGAVQGGAGTDAAKVFASFRYDRALSYDDPHGNGLHFGYDRRIGQAAVILTPTPDTDIKVIGLFDHLADDRQPHFSLDPTRTDRDVGKAILTVRRAGVFDQVQVGGTLVRVDREADNFTLRAPAGPRMRVNVDYDIHQIDATGTLTAGGLETVLGLSGKLDKADSVRRNVTAGDVVNSYRFPGVEQTALGLWAETAAELAEGRELRAGLRYDLVHGSAGKAGMTPATGVPLFDQSPAALYRAYYGVADTSVTDHNVSGKVGYSHAIPAWGTRAFAEVGRMVRTPTPVERWQAVSGPPASRWVGNPALEPEKHHRAEAGLEFRGDGYDGYQRSRGDAPSWMVRLGAFYDRVQDFVTFDRARGQAGVLAADGATVSRNVDATLAGLDAALEWNVTRHLSTRLAVSYLYGENESDGRPLYQVRPLAADWLLDYRAGLGPMAAWNLGASLRFSGRQDRVDDDALTGLGMDNDGPSGAFALLGLHGGLRWRDRFGLTLGVDNLLDKRTNEHLTGDHIADVNRTAVPAPGRTVYLRFVAAL
ncbi:MAG: TonB-dependent receptor [Hyphomicrobiales bacterium]|nr:TonB-dependent receptor [Hyphomicrobiales bacterium]MCP5370249.1 TonB-dependent receptor [Hyphomicrobiales bacterium]